MKTKRAFTLIEIMIVVAIIGMLAAVAIPGLRKALRDAQQRTCILNLHSIQGAKIRWAVDQKKADTDAPTDADLFGPATYIEKKPECPAGGSYLLNSIESKPTCTIAGHAL